MLPTTFQRIWLVRPIPQVKYTRTIYPYITSGFNYSIHGTAYLLTNNHSWSGIPLPASCAEVIRICICSAEQCYREIHQYEPIWETSWWIYKFLFHRFQSTLSDMLRIGKNPPYFDLPSAMHGIFPGLLKRMHNMNPLMFSSTVLLATSVMYRPCIWACLLH